LVVAELEESDEGAPQDEPTQEVQADEEASEELQECPNHRPSSFERGKPRSISPLVCKYLTYALIMTDALSLEVDCNRCCIIPYLPLLLYP
jgi:hypothetical protein